MTTSACSTSRWRNQASGVGLTFVAGFFFMSSTLAAIHIEVAGNEELVSRPQAIHCRHELLLDSPARPMRRKDGSLVVFATHFSNWYFAGADWNGLKPVCASAASGKEDSRPETVDDRYWIQALSLRPEGHIVALASHEYLGARHPGQCNISPTREQPYPCWFSSIIQLESKEESLTFTPPEVHRIVATPQIVYDRGIGKRQGFLTTSNIVSDGDWIYSLIYVDGYGRQETGTCLFRASSKESPSRWLAWNGTDFGSSLERPVTQTSESADPVACKPLNLGNQNRGLVRLRGSEQWIAVGIDRETRGAKRAGVFFAESKDLLNWSPRKIAFELQIDFKAPECNPVYKYPTIIDHGAVGANFDNTGGQAYVYLVKVILKSCKPVERQLVRFPIKISNSR